MSTVLLSAPLPALRVDADVTPIPSAIFGIRIDSAVNLLEAREYGSLPREQRLSKALEEQRAFVGQLLEPSLGLVDLRTRVTPHAPTPLEVALLGRVWSESSDDRRSLAGDRRERLLASMPRHVNASVIEDSDELACWLSPFGPDDEQDAAMITRREITGIPRRRDAQVEYYFSVIPFNWAEGDWTNLYATLSGCPVPLVLSVALLPLPTPPDFRLLLTHYATFYARLAKEDRLTGGLYSNDRLLPPDAFAVDAQAVFDDYARRYHGPVFAIRVQVTAAGRIPPGMVESIGAAISPGDVEATHLSGSRAASAFEVRRAGDDYERDLARWNLSALDVGLLDGAPEIWRRPDPPPPLLAALCVLGDARDATCAFRLPIAVDGVLPGFRVRRGAFGQDETHTPAGPTIRLGHLGDGGAVDIAVDDLTKHALVAGSTGSGKTTTVLELLRQLWCEHRIPFLVIEPVNADADDYRRLLGEPGFDDMEVYTVGDEGLRPLRFNPFEVPEGVLVAEHTANLLACFTAAFGLWEPLPSIYQEALNLTYLNSGILASEHGTGGPRAWPTVVEFMHAMRSVTSQLGYAGEVKHNIEAASIRRAAQLVGGGSASAFLTDQQNDIAGLLDRPVVLELKSLGTGDEQALMIALLLNAITEHYQALRGASKRLEHVTVVEEAHRLLARPEGTSSPDQAQAKEKAAQAFANTLAENRKYGEGIIIAEQLPTKLVVDAVKNTNLKVMHRLTADDDRVYMGDTMGLDESQRLFATRLVTGEALVYGDALAEAMLIGVKPRLARTHPSSLSPRPAPPFASCSRCRAQCQFRGAALAMLRDPALGAGVRQEVATLEDNDATQRQRDAAWVSLLDLLRTRIRAFPALPSTDPGRSDAAYCVFLHAIASHKTHFAPSWAEAVARRLAIVGDAPEVTVSHVR